MSKRRVRRPQLDDLGWVETQYGEPGDTLSEACRIGCRRLPSQVDTEHVGGFSRDVGGRGRDSLCSGSRGKWEVPDRFGRKSQRVSSQSSKEN